MKLRPNEKRYWEAYVKTLSRDARPKSPNVVAEFAGSREITDDLIALYLSGKKTAGSSIEEDFISAGDDPPKIGNFWIVLNSTETPSCILKTEKIVRHKFRDVPVGIAMAEGEGDLTLEYWRRVHKEFYSPYLKKWGLESIEDATVITEFFTLVYAE